MAVKIVENELTRRAQKPTEWEPCPHCGRRLESKGFIKREMTTLIGKIVWWLRGGRCPSGCKIGQVVPLDEEFGLEPYQRTSFELKYLAVAWLSDGGRGFWRLYRERFATLATGILDFYHAAQNLWKGAAVWLDGRTTQARTWFVTARHQLRH